MALTTISTFTAEELYSVDVAKMTAFWKNDGFPLGQYQAAASKSEAVMTVPQHGYAYAFSSLPAPPTKRKYDNAWTARSKALAYVNTARAALGHEPISRLPIGDVGNSEHCVLGRALPGSTRVGTTISFATPEMAAAVGGAWAAPVAGCGIETPEALRAFIHHFDNGHYRDLIRNEGNSPF
jgi:hypothetical protein